MDRMVAQVKELIKDWCKSPYILVVEDEKLDGELMYETLTRFGCEVHLATDAPGAIQFVRDHCNDIDIIFLDLKLHGEDGVGVLSVAKQVCPSVPVVLVTGYTSGEIIERAVRVGYVGIVEKPLTRITLDQILNAHKIGPSTDSGSPCI